ncbi:MAG: DNA alkylation repair protein [Paramuribaculum sp.]|nr:DNA alkylation repair protein [Paramuribaculum sp.]
MDKFIQVKEEFEKLSNPHKAKEMSAYMRNRFKFYGIHTPLRRKAYKPVISTDKKCGVIDWEFLDMCWNDEHREFHYIVADYLVDLHKYIKYEDISKIEKYVRSNQWWDTIDGLYRIFGFLGLTDKRINALMLKWSTDEDFWVRRIAIEHQLGRKDKTDTDLLKKIIANNFGSTEFFINKAIGWSLRDYSKTNPAWVSDFIKRHRNSLHSLSIREGSKYIKPKDAGVCYY